MVLFGHYLPVRLRVQFYGWGSGKWNLEAGISRLERCYLCGVVGTGFSQLQPFPFDNFTLLERIVLPFSFLNG